MRTKTWLLATLPLLATCVALGCSGADGPTPDQISDDTGGSGDDTGTSGDTGIGGGDTGIGGDTGPGTDTPPPATTVKTVFVIVMENHSWGDIKGNKSAPYINGTLLPMASHAEAYFTPPGNHPSEPNYIWLEAGDNLKITNDNDPGSNHQSTTDHLVTQLQAKGVTWKTYQEDIDGKSCPLTSSGLFAAKHCPMLFFDDVTDTNKATSANCIAHVRPYSELAADLSAGKAAQYNFITPNLCDDMHGETFGTTCNSTFSDLVAKGDTWLQTEVPKILDSAQYKDNGALFIVWDEGTASPPLIGTSSDGPIGMLVISPLAKGGGYPGSVKYTHSSTLRTIQRIFGVPYLRDARAATDLADLFKDGALP
jgi:hypothetical protein